jgi:hypothetical protein
MRRALENQSAGSEKAAASTFDAALAAAENAPAPAVEKPAARQDSVIESTNRQVSANTATKDASINQEEERERLPPIASDKSGRTFHDFENPIPMVEARLRQLGVDPTGVRFSLWDEVVANLGGHYTNHYINVVLPNGHRENYSIEWTLRNPVVTAVDIQRLMQTPPPFSTS